MIINLKVKSYEKFIILLVSVIILIASAVFAGEPVTPQVPDKIKPGQEYPPSPNPVPSVISPSITKIPEGAIINEDKVTIKEGYKFRPLSKSEAAIVYMRRNNVTGKIACVCHDTGTCSIYISGTTLSCQGVCKDGCSLSVKIPDTPKSNLVQPE